MSVTDGTVSAATMRTEPSESAASGVALSADEAAVLAGNAWFAGLPVAIRGDILAASQRVRLASGDRLHARGDPPTGWYAVLRGAIKASNVTPEGKEVALTFIEPGGWFGEISLLDGWPRTHDGIAHGETELLQVPPAAFDVLLQRHPTLLRAIAQLLCNRLRLAFLAIEDYNTLPLENRLAKQLVNLARTYGEPAPDGVRLKLRLPQEELAQLLGASRQRVNAELSQWAKSGWVTVRYGVVVIHDLAALAHVARA